jgi:hypothetical protein
MRWMEQYGMKHLRIAGLCLVSTFLLGLVLVGSASAALWETCSEGTGLTKYSSNQCTTAEAGGKWQREGITATDKATITGFTLTLTDTKTALGVTKVRCDSGLEGKGTVGPVGNLAVVETLEVKEAEKNCRGVEGGCESSKIEKIKGVDLPWQEELFETEKKILATIEADGGGEPGWAVTCKTVLGSKTDTCTSEGGQTEEVLLENKLSSGSLLVLGTLEKKRKADCTEGGKESGEAEGQEAILLASKGALQVGAEPPWLSRTNVAGVGPRGTGECKYLAAKEKCSLTFKNVSTRTLAVVSVAIDGTNGNTRYTTTVAGCAFNLGLGECTNEVENAVFVAATRNPYCLQVRDAANNRELRRLCAELAM